MDKETRKKRRLVREYSWLMPHLSEAEIAEKAKADDIDEQFVKDAVKAGFRCPLCDEGGFKSKQDVRSHITSLKDAEHKGRSGSEATIGVSGEEFSEVLGGHDGDVSTSLRPLKPDERSVLAIAARNPETPLKHLSDELPYSYGYSSELLRELGAGRMKLSDEEYEQRLKQLCSLYDIEYDGGDSEETEDTDVLEESLAEAEAEEAAGEETEEYVEVDEALGLSDFNNRELLERIHQQQMEILARLDAVEGRSVPRVIGGRTGGVGVREIQEVQRRAKQ